MPTTAQEKADCTKWLSPQQLHQVIIGPPTLDFGQVCLRSVITRNLSIVNNLNQYIHIVAEVSCVMIKPLIKANQYMYIKELLSNSKLTDNSIYFICLPFVKNQNSLILNCTKWHRYFNFLKYINYCGQSESSDVICLKYNHILVVYPVRLKFLSEQQQYTSK